MKEKKRKKKQREDEGFEEIQGESTVDSTKEHKKKRKNKSKDNSQEECFIENKVQKTILDSATEEVDLDGRKKKKKRAKLKEESPDVDEHSEIHEPKKKKKRRHKHKDPEYNEEGNPSGAHNSLDVVEDNSKLKKTKKRKKDKTKQKEQEEMTHSRVIPAVDVGQWVTADLGDSNRQTKFYQLLGGFKKACSNTDSSTSSTVKPFAAKFNAALDKKREADLNGKLEQQFENARFTQLNARGLGLGFSQTKKNSIDISASRSKKFDD